MRRACFLITSVFVGGLCLGAAGQDTPGAGGSGLPVPDARGRSAEERERPRGSSANQWRYRFNAGRWWYRTPEGGWSYFDGNQWRSFVAGREYDRRWVDPALLNIEAKEGVLGTRRWPRVAGGAAGGGGAGSAGGAAGGGGLLMSGTRGSLGGSYSNGIGGVGGGWRPPASTGMGMRGR